MNNDQAIQLILWHYRHLDPNLSVTISESEEKAFAECCTYHSKEPKVTIVQREGKDGKPSYTVIAVTDSEENAIKPVENNEKDYALAEKARKRAQYAASAVELAARVKNNAAAGDFSSNAINELADTVLALV